MPALVLAVLGYWRDEGPTHFQPPLISSEITLLPWWGWVITGLAVLMLVTLEGSFRLVAQADPSLVVVPESSEIDDSEMGAWDYVPEGIRAMTAYRKILNRTTKLQSALAVRMQRNNEREKRTSDFAKKQRIGIDTAKQIDKMTARLQETLPYCGRNLNDGGEPMSVLFG